MQHMPHRRVKAKAAPAAAPLRTLLLPTFVLVLAILILVIRSGGAG